MWTTTLLGEVRALVVLVPPGAVTTYGDIARALGVSPRQVGRAMAMLDDGFPWHRVVHADGTPATCHQGTAPVLLRAELTPMAGRRVDLRAARWRPHPASSPEITEG
jgi:alkylated DNA nucleotide flippase Atl1